MFRWRVSSAATRQNEPNCPRRLRTGSIASIAIVNASSPWRRSWTRPSETVTRSSATPNPTANELRHYRHRPSILRAGNVHRRHIHQADRFTENMLSRDGEIVRIISFNFRRAVLVGNENVQNIVVYALHPHSEAESVKFPRAYQGV